MKKIIFILSICTLYLSSCGSENDYEPTQEEIDNAIALKNYVPEIIERKGIKLTEANDYPKFEDIELKFNSAAQRFKNGKNNIEFSITGFNLGEGTADEKEKNYVINPLAQHLTLKKINGDEIKTANSSIEVDLDYGDNIMLATLNRSYNMSLKGNNASSFFRINIKNDGSTVQTNITDTALFYLEPKGTYVQSDVDHILLDFFLKNIELQKGGNYLSVNINNTEFRIYRNKPYWISGLPIGTHTIKIGLRNKEDKPINAPFLRDIEEVITIKEISILEN